MKYSIKHLIMTLISLCLLTTTASIAHTSAAQIEKQTSISSMLEQATPAIVNIAVEQILMKKLNDLMLTNDDQTKVPVKTYAVGSGVIFDAAKGFIVTNAHVLKNEKVIVVTLKDGRRYHGSLVAKDTDYDIAILKIDAPHLVELPFANSDSIKVGDFVTAIGSPYGLSQTVTSGMVSALNRSHPQIEGYQNFIQTDASINPGNSGGALINLKGQLIGINTAIVAPMEANAGIGFAIPSNMVYTVIQQLLIYGKVERGVLGVLVQNVTPTLVNSLKLSSNKGALISDILPNTPAKTAGFQVTDLITAVNGHPIDSAEQLRNTLGLIRPATTVAITILRNQQAKILHVTIANPKTLKENLVPYFSGVRLQPFHELQPDGTKLEGLLLTDISDESQSALAGFQIGDVITAVNKMPVTSLNDLLQIVAHQTQPLLITISRGAGHLFLVLEKH